MLSMYDNPEYVQQALQAGARGYVLKDAPAAEIVAAIEAVAAGGTFLSPAVSQRLFRNQAPRPLLTPRESEILSALGRGESSKQIARDLAQRAHGRGAPAEHQAEARHRRAGGADQVRGRARPPVRRRLMRAGRPGFPLGNATRADRAVRRMPSAAARLATLARGSHRQGDIRMHSIRRHLVWLVVAVVGAFALGTVALARGEAINALWVVVAAVCTYLIAYRYYSLFIADTRAAARRQRARRPRVRHNDGLDYVPTNKYVLFGHHFAAIAGAGPLVGPVLAAQMGYLPGTAVDPGRRGVRRRGAGLHRAVHLDAPRRPLARRHDQAGDGHRARA